MNDIKLRKIREKLKRHTLLEALRNVWLKNFNFKLIQKSTLEVSSNVTKNQEY